MELWDYSLNDIYDMITDYDLVMEPTYAERTVVLPDRDEVVVVTRLSSYGGTYYMGVDIVSDDDDPDEDMLMAIDVCNDNGTDDGYRKAAYAFWNMTQWISHVADNGEYKTLDELSTLIYELPEKAVNAMVEAQHNDPFFA